jgi:nitroreductase
MTFADVIRRRRMVRSFTDQPVDPELVRGLIRSAQRAPSAGNTASLHCLLLDEPAAVARYWDVTLPQGRRSGFRWPGLLDAPVLIVPCCSADSYLRRYAEPDKAATGLGDDQLAWPVPYWYVDGGAAVMLLLLAAVDAGLGALFFGQFGHAAAVKTAFSIPDEYEPLGTVALGHPAADDPAGRSVGRVRAGLDEIIHRGDWRG